MRTTRARGSNSLRFPDLQPPTPAPATGRRRGRQSCDDDATAATWLATVALALSLVARRQFPVMAGLVIGKPLGIMAATWLVARLRHAHLDEQLGWVDVLGLSLLGGIGFTVSLLIGELAFGAGTARDDHVKVAVLVGSLAAASLAAVVLRVRNRTHRLICEAESADHDRDGVPDVYQAGQAQQIWR
jgi:hypothetical protein